MSAVYIQVYFRQERFMEANKMNPDQTAPIWVHICNAGYLRTYADERGGNKSCDWREKGLGTSVHIFTGLWK